MKSPISYLAADAAEPRLQNFHKLRIFATEPDLAIGHDPGQHASYVSSWIKVLQEDPKEILRAARDAEQINRYVMALEKNRALPEQGAENKAEIDRAVPEKPTRSVASRGR